MKERVFRWGVLLLISLLPIETRYIFRMGEVAGSRWEYGDLSLYLSDLLLLGVAALTLIGTTDRPRAPRALAATVLTLLAWMYLSSLWAPDEVLALYTAAKFSLATLLLAIVSYRNVPQHLIIAAIVAAAVVQGLLALLQFGMQEVTAVPLLGMAYHDAVTAGDAVVEGSFGRILRPYGTLAHPNVLGGFLAVSLLLLMGAMTEQRGEESSERRHKRFTPQFVISHLSFAIIALGLLLSFSRGAWLGFLVGLAFLFWLSARRGEIGARRIVNLLSPFLLSAVVFLLLLFPFVGTRFSGERLEVRSITERASSIAESLPLIASHPIFGVGAGNYTRSLLENLPAPQVWADQPVHNTFLLMLAELGVVGLILTLVLIVIITRHAVASRTALVAAPLAALATMGLFDHWIWSLHFGVFLLFLVLGLALRKEPFLPRRAIAVKL